MRAAVMLIVGLAIGIVIGLIAFWLLADVSLNLFLPA